MSGNDDRVDFGLTRVPRAEKAGRVRGVFDSVVERYDLMNDLMSFGMHRLWKRFTIDQARLRPGQNVLDLAGGTGDLARLAAREVGRDGRVVLADINAAMLARGRDRLLDAGLAGNVAYVQADAERLPFAAGAFDCVTIGFGLRNVTSKDKALAEMYRVLRPGGCLMVLEAARPPAPALESLHRLFTFNALPALGRAVVGDADSYRYLAESISVHPDQETLLGMLEAAGFERCRYHNLSGGIAALHIGYHL